MKDQFSRYLLKYREIILVLILVIFYTVGTVGLSLEDHRNWFLSLSAFNLILSFSVMVLGRRTEMLRFLFFLGICFIAGMTVEWVGTRTGYLFGDYFYGKNLGTKLFGVPLVIGLNWGVLVVTSASIANRISAPVFVKALAGAALMTLLDLIMEPVAVESDFWTWTNGYIPVFNYVCWFLVALPLQWIYFKFRIAESNKVFDSLFLILALFFILLNIF